MLIHLKMVKWKRYVANASMRLQGFGGLNEGRFRKYPEFVASWKNDGTSTPTDGEL